MWLYFIIYSWCDDIQIYSYINKTISNITIFILYGREDTHIFFLVVEPLTLGKVELSEVKTTLKKNYRLEMV